VLRGNHRNFSKDKMTHNLASLTGQGLITSEGDFWRRQRQMAQPSFQRERVDRYGAVMVAYAERLRQEWRDGQTRDIHHDLMSLTLRIVARVLFESAADRYEQEVSHCLAVAADVFAGPLGAYPILQWLPIPASLRYRRAIRRLDRIMYGIVRARRAGTAELDDLLGRLLAARDESGGRMTDRQLRDELLTLFLAGHETTALTLTFTFYLLGTHAEADTRLAVELRDVLGGRLPTAADVPQLRYTGWVVQEAMRLYPPAWSIGREALADCEIGGYPVPKGTQLAISQWVVHRDARWFDAPETFWPERWDNDLARRLPRCAYFPFGDGPRICIGNHFAMLEAILLLATLAQRFRLELAAGENLELVPSITLRPRRGLRMTERERQPS
jgi:cytochrome P450